MEEEGRRSKGKNTGCGNAHKGGGGSEEDSEDEGEEKRRDYMAIRAGRKESVVRWR